MTESHHCINQSCRKSWIFNLVTVITLYFLWCKVFLHRWKLRISFRWVTWSGHAPVVHPPRHGVGRPTLKHSLSARPGPATCQLLRGADHEVHRMEFDVLRGWGLRGRRCEDCPPDRPGPRLFSTWRRFAQLPSHLKTQNIDRQIMVTTVTTLCTIAKPFENAEHWQTDNGNYGDDALHNCQAIWKRRTLTDR